MSACATECGGVASEGHALCPACALLWADSDEKREAVEKSHGTGEGSWETAALDSLATFIARARAERQNGGKS